MRIDMHVHYMPPEKAMDEDFFQREPFWRLLTKPGSTSVQGWADVDRLVRDMDAAGVDQAVIQGEYFAEHDSATVRNRQIERLCKVFPGRLVGFAAIQPKAGEKALSELERCLDQGMRGVGEISPYAQGLTMDDPDFLRMAEACISHDVPLVLHVNEEVGHYYPGKATIPLRHYYRLALRYPELKLILAHWGGGLFFYELMPDVRRALKNVWYDTAASPLIYRTLQIFRVALECVEPHKLLYASDYPLLLYPRKQKEPDMTLFLSEIEELGLEKGAYDALLGENATDLLSGKHSTDGRANAAYKRPLSYELPKIDADSSVSWIAHVYHETRPILDRYEIPWEDSPVPHWEPLRQAACAHGFDEEKQRRLVRELQHAVESSTQK